MHGGAARDRFVMRSDRISARLGCHGESAFRCRVRLGRTLKTCHTDNIRLSKKIKKKEVCIHEKNTRHSSRFLLQSCVSECSPAAKGNGDKDPASTDNGTGTTAPVEQREQNLTPLVVGYSAFNEKFSPFFAESAYDQDVMELTQIGLLGNDRQGAIIMKGIEGETKEYNGHSYTYTGASDCKITENTDGTVTYAFKLREGMTFSDGKPVTVDDVIFSMYVLCDPTYDGSSTLFAVPIKGMDEYRAGMTTLSKYFPMVGRDKADLSIVTAEQQTAFWKAFDEGLVPFAQAIVDYCVEAGANEAGDIAGAAANWGFDGLKEDATVEDFAMAIGEKYSWVFSAMEAETAGVVLSEVMDKEVYNNYPTTAVKYGDSAASISGIEKQDDYNMTVTLTQVDATAIYQLGVTVAPMHYYGDEAQFDYANNKFGFPKGDLSVVRAKTTTPMGAGPYKFIKYENGVVSFESQRHLLQGQTRFQVYKLQRVHLR